MGLGSEIRDPEKNLFRIPDPGVKKAPDPGSGSATLLPIIGFNNTGNVCVWPSEECLAIFCLENQGK
jgi:hypothetical protein